MYVYDYENITEKDDLKRLNNGTYECAYQWNLSGQSITALSCLNTIQSPLLFAATSDKKLYVLDTSSSKILREIESPHDRSIHCISLPQPSQHCSINTSEYNMFTTSAIDNIITLWDLRQSTAIARYNNHINRRDNIGCSISPCLKYLVTGSEDRSCRIIDLRTLKEVNKLTGHKDVCMDAKFNPLFPQLVTCSLDGTVKFYIDPMI